MDTRRGSRIEGICCRRLYSAHARDTGRHEPSNQQVARLACLKSGRMLNLHLLKRTDGKTSNDVISKDFWIANLAEALRQRTLSQHLPQIF